jgi:hypothetical protein
VLTDAAAQEEVLFGPEGVASQIPRGGRDRMSTVGLTSIGSAWRLAPVTLLDAPCSAACRPWRRAPDDLVGGDRETFAATRSAAVLGTPVRRPKWREPC